MDNIEVLDFLHYAPLNKTYFVDEITTDGVYILKHQNPEELPWAVSPEFLKKELEAGRFQKIEND